MESNRDSLDLSATVRSLRPTPEPEFAARLDARAADGFPRASRSWGSRLVEMADRVRAVPPRRVLAPAGAVALTAIVVATAVVSVTGTDPGNPSVSRFGAAATSPPAADRPAGAGVQHGTQAPVPSSSRAGSNSSSSAGSTLSEFEARSGASWLPSIAPHPSGPYASRANRRDIERSAQIVLGAEPSEVRAGVARVLDAVHATGGIVLRSSIQDGDEGEAGASFELLIPSPRLGDALATFSAIAEVRSRRESTQDITAPTIGVEERLEDSRARIESLLGQLSEAGSDEERAAVEAQLRAERRLAAALRSRLTSLRRRANFSRVSLRIETGAPLAAGRNSSGWGVSDALDDAGRILTIAAGVTVIALAILGPLALIAFLLWLAHRTLARRSRERTLD